MPSIRTGRRRSNADLARDRRRPSPAAEREGPNLYILSWLTGFGESMANIARTIIRDSLRAKPDEAIIIQAGKHTIDLATQVALEAFKAGADPAIMYESDDAFFGQFKHLSEEQLRKTSAHCLGIADYVQSYVWVGGVENPAPMRRVPKAKWAAMFEGEDAHYRKNLEKKQKQVSVALGAVTRPRAKTYGFNFARWRRMVEDAIATDYKSIRRTGQVLAGLLSRPAQVRVRADNGTDLRFRLAGETRMPFLDDGIIGDEDLAIGNTTTSLPAGAIYVAPVEDSANGTIVSDVGIPQVGTLIQGLSWTFRDGHVVDFTAKRNLKSAQLNYVEGSGAKDRFGTFGVGLNKKVVPGYLDSFYAHGTVTVGIGDNKSLGGGNTSTYGFSAFQSHATVTIDGKPIVEEGRLVA